jgi:diguanylate cyclase
MTSILLNLLFYFSAIVLASATTWWFCYSYFHNKEQDDGKGNVRHAAEILNRLQELSTNVAVEVDRHNSEVEGINDKLNSAASQKPTVVVDVVAQLIQANQNMQKRLATTEDKLRKQAREIEIHAAEARTDALTLLANRRAFDDELIQRIAEFKRLGRTFSMIMADVDHFKKFNDTYGHQAGDNMLQNTAKMLRRSMREMDLVTRYGGEEFAVILPGTVLKDACKAAMRARETIEKMRSHNDLPGDVHITMSFGVAELLKNEDRTAFVNRVDKTLYVSKENGRNCIFQHDGKNILRVDGDKQSAVAKNEAQLQGHSQAEERQEDKTSKATIDDGGAASKSKPTANAEPNLVADMPGRTHFCQIVRSRSAEWKRGGPKFSVVLLEVNRHDHCEGQTGSPSREHAMQIGAKYLTSTLREMDVVGNYAPGCFALLLPTAGLVDAIRVAERLREGFHQYCLSAQDGALRLAFSVGVVQVSETDESVSLLKRAEAALDVAVRRGGNRTYYHDGERCAPITAMLETMDYLS